MAQGKERNTIRQEFGRDPRGMTSGELKDLYSGVPEGDVWKLELLRDMLWARQGMLDRGEEGEDAVLSQYYIEILAET